MKKGKKRPTSTHVQIKGSVPKTAPKYMSSFFTYVASTLTNDVKRQEKVQTCDRIVQNMFNEHWKAFQEYAASTRPPKKQRTEQPYNETKLSKDTKAIETKLQTMDEHLHNLNQDEILEHIQNIYLLTKQIYRKVRHGSTGEDDGTDVQVQSRMDVPSQTEVSDRSGTDVTRRVDWCNVGVDVSNPPPPKPEESITVESTVLQTPTVPAPSTETLVLTLPSMPPPSANEPAISTEIGKLT